MSKIKDDNFYTIKGWMLNRLKLKGAQLQIYSIIYGFSQDGESEFTGSLNYLKDWLGVSKPTVIKALQALEDAGLIIKTPLFINNVTFNKYKVNRKVIDSIFNDGKETLLPIQEPLQVGCQETLPTGSQETLPNKDISYKELDIDKNKDIYTSAEPTEAEGEFLEIVETIKQKKTATKKATGKSVLYEGTEYHTRQEICNLVKDIYNETCVSLTRARTVTDKRSKAIMKLVDKYGIEQIVKAFSMAEESDFLKGKNDRGWVADFDFVLREDPFVSILEGRKYANKGKKLQGGSNGRPTESPTISYIEQQARQNPNSGLAKLFEEL